MSKDRNGRDPKPSPASAAEGNEQNKNPAEERAERRQKILTLLISLVVACGLWLYVMEAVNPVIQRSFSGIRVRVMNEAALASENLTVTSEEDQYVRVRVSGKRRTLMSLDGSDFIATVDASDCAKGENYINVEVRTQAPVSIEKIASSQIRLDVESIVTESREVKVKYNGDVKEGYQPVTVEQEISSVEVTGAESAVRKVTEVRAELQTEKLSDGQTDFNLKLTAVDRKDREVDGVRLGQERLRFSARMYAQKEVELSTSYAGQVKDGFKLVEFEVPASIRIALPDEEADRVFSVTTDAVDLTDIEKNTTVDLSLHLPGSAVLAEGQEVPQAVLKVAKITQQVLKMNTSDIKVENLPAGRELSFDSSTVAITLTGTASDLSALEKKNLKLSVNAAWVSRYTVELPLTVAINTDSDQLDVKAEAETVAVTVR